MKTLSIEKKIYYHDTDCGGVVYYANYLNYLEEARTEYFTACGFDLAELAAEGTQFVVSHVELDYKAPGRYQNTLTITTTIEEISRARIIFTHRILRADKLLVKSLISLVCINAAFQVQSIPDAIRDTFMP